MSTIQLKIISPERVLFDDQVEQVSLPTQMGEITVLPNHIPVITLLQAGEILVKQKNNNIPLVVSGGFAEVSGKKVLILADTAERVEEIDEKRAEEAQTRAQEMLKEKRMDAKEYAYLVAKIEKEFTRIKVSRKYKKRGMGHQR